MKTDLDCLIIGGGPGGLVSALYLSRYMRKIAVASSGVSRACWIPKTYNLLGYPNGVEGTELLRVLRKQVLRYKTPIIPEEAQILSAGKTFRIQLGKDVLTSKKIILATGILDKQPDIDNVTQLRTRGLLRYCPICDAFEHRGQILTILAASEKGFQSALFLSHYSKQLHLVVPPRVRISAKMKQLLYEKKVQVHRSRLQGIEETRSKNGIWISTTGEAPFFSRAAYVLLGAEVKDSAFRKLAIKCDSNGFLVASKYQELSVPGMYGVGDCVSHLAQISVATGHAALAATRVHRSL